MSRLVAAVALVVIAALGAAPASAAKDPRISLKPATGRPGDSVHVSGEGFGVGSKIHIRWDDGDVANSFSADGTF